MWQVYIMKCSDGTLYTGITTDIARRLSQHNESKTGAKYTRSRRPVELAYLRTIDSRSKAASLELEIKRMTRFQKLELISHNAMRKID